MPLKVKNIKKIVNLKKFWSKNFFLSTRSNFSGLFRKLNEESLWIQEMCLSMNIHEIYAIWFWHPELIPCTREGFCWWYQDSSNPAERNDDNDCWNCLMVASFSISLSVRFNYDLFHSIIQSIYIFLQRLTASPS